MDAGYRRAYCRRQATAVRGGIVAAARCVSDDDTRPPDVLLEYWRFLRYGLAPNGGGQRDQPAGWFARAEFLHRVYNAFGVYKQREAGQDAQWINAHPDEWSIVKAVKGMMNV